MVPRVPFKLLCGAFGFVEGIGPEVRTGGDGTAAGAFQGACGGGAGGATVGGGLEAVLCVPDESG